MNKNHIKTLACLLAACGFGLAQAAPAPAAASATTPAAHPAGKGYQMQSAKSLEMTVKSVDQKNRALTLVDKNGDELIVHAGEKVKYISQAKPGDKLTTTVVDSVAFMPAATNSRTTTEKQELAKNVPGYAPELTYTSTKTTTVKVLSVAPKKNMVTVQNAQGNAEKLKVSDPALQARLVNIKAGDNIEITIKHVVNLKVQAKK